jgi:hypothetical protein
MWGRALTMIAVILLTVCALPPATKDRTYLEYEIRNFNWAQATVEFTCEGMLLGYERGIETGEVVRGKVPLRNCMNPEFHVELLASNSIYRSEIITAWNRTTTLFIRVENNLGLTSYYVNQ